MSKLVSGLGIAFSLVFSLFAGAVLSRASTMPTSNQNDMVQLVCVVVILASIVAFGVCAFFFARQK